MSRRNANAPLTFVIVASLTALGLAAATAHTPSGPDPNERPPAVGVPWPEGFGGWAWVKSGPSAPLLGQPAGTHHIYANARAVQGYRTGRWEDGAVLVFDVLTPGATHGAATDPGTRLRTDVMVRDQARYAATGGWGYAEWFEAAAQDGATGRRPNAWVTANPDRACHACHTRREAQGFVFSEMPESGRQ